MAWSLKTNLYHPAYNRYHKSTGPSVLTALIYFTHLQHSRDKILIKTNTRISLNLSPAHTAMQAFCDWKLFAFPSHPPNLNSWHFFASGSYLQRIKSALQCPLMGGNLQITAGTWLSSKIKTNVINTPSGVPGSRRNARTPESDYRSFRKGQQLCCWIIHCEL